MSETPETTPETPAPPSLPNRKHCWLALAACIALALFWSWGYRDARSWGWDESMHAELPAARLALSTAAIRPAAAMAAVHDSDRYPIVFPALLAVPQFFFGISEDVARRSAIAVWCGALFALFLLARELARAARGPSGEPLRNEAWVPWLTLAFAAASPMGHTYGASLFLESPFVLTGALALRGWLRRGSYLGEDTRLLRERRAGAWFVLAFFTKFNYSLLLALGCGVDWMIEGFCELRAGRGHAYLRRTAHLLFMPALIGTWWFLAPLPHGLETAAEHREAFYEFLGGNQQGNGQGADLRILYMGCFFAITLRVLGVQILGALVGLGAALRGSRVLWLALLATFLPIWLHPFFLDRFWLPLGISFWPLAALGIARILPRAPSLAVPLVAVLALAVSFDPTADVTWLAGRFGMLQTEEPLASYQAAEFAKLSELGRGPGRSTSPALLRGEREELDQLLAGYLGPMERVAWLGISSEYSPAALHLGLLENGGASGRFLRDAHMPLDLDFRGNLGYGEWTNEQLAEWANEFDVILIRDPVDFGQRVGRGFMRTLQQRLCNDLGWRAELVGHSRCSKGRMNPRPSR